MMRAANLKQKLTVTVRKAVSTRQPVSHSPRGSGRANAVDATRAKGEVPVAAAVKSTA